MNDRIHEPENQPQRDSRENLFFLLQTLARHAQARADESKSAESFIKDEQIQTL